MTIITSRILPGGIEVRGHVDSKRQIYKKAFDFFCDKFKEESSADAAADAEEEYGVSIYIEKKQYKFKTEKRYDVYISKKEHS